ncbi:MAG: hypothetical protein WC822_06265 [Candidatus Paceibacterota bacterium]
MTTTLDKVTKAQTTYFLTLQKRMDEDAKLAYLDPYKLVDSKGRPINDTISITMNDPAVFANAIASILISGKWQTVVEGNITATQTHKIENFVDSIDDAAEDKYPKPGISGIHTFHCNHVCVRGWIGERVLWLTDRQGFTYPDVLPMDMRYFVYEQGKDGLNWGCYMTYRSAELVKSEYPKANVRDSDQVLVYDYWDDKVNEVWIGDYKVLEQKNSLSYPPFVLQPVSAGFMLLDKGYMNREGESLFFLDRDLYPELNRLMSIDQTLAMKSIMPPYQKQEAELTGKNPGYPGGIGAVKTVLPDEKYELIPQPDTNQATIVAHQNIQNGVTRGGVTDIDVGNVKQPTSAVSITEQSELRNKILQPRVQALTNLKASRARMLLDQYAEGELGTIEIGSRGLRKSFDTTVIGDPNDYRVSYRLMTQDKKQKIANIALADAAQGKLSKDTILRDILKSDDPEGEMSKLKAEEAEAFDPVIKFIRLTFSLIDEADKLHEIEKDQKLIEAKRLAQKCVQLIQQEKTMGVTPPQSQGLEQKGNQAQALLALPKMFGGGTGQPQQAVTR